MCLVCSSYICILGRNNTRLWNWFIFYYLIGQELSFHVDCNVLTFMDSFWIFSWNIISPLTVIIYLRYRSSTSTFTELCYIVLSVSDLCKVNIYTHRYRPTRSWCIKACKVRSTTFLAQNIKIKQLLGTFAWTVWRSKDTNQTDYIYRWSDQTKVTWEEADNACRERGWLLAKILNAKEDLFLRNRLKETNGSGSESWIGLKLKLGSTVKYQFGNWSDGAPFIHNVSRWGYTIIHKYIDRPVFLTRLTAFWSFRT